MCDCVIVYVCVCLCVHSQVSEVNQGVYRLKSSYFNNVDVDQWPFYTEAQRQMLKRMIQSKCHTSEVSSSSGVKEEAVGVTYKVSGW